MEKYKDKNKNNKKSLLKSVLLFLTILGPGIITSTVDNDAGGITTYSVAGAHFGYSMLWALIPILIALIVIQEMCARMGVVTGKGLADLIRENFGLKMTFFIMFGLLIANFAVTVSEFSGITAAGNILGFNKFILIPMCVVVIWLLIIKTNYRILEKFFLSLTLFYIAYVISGLMAKPDWGNVVKEIVHPTFSLTYPYIYLLIGVIGTTITPWMQFYLQAAIVEKGIRIKDYKYSKLEVIIGSVTTVTVSFFIIVVCATMIFPRGIMIETASDAAIALEPVAGYFAETLFAVGLFGAAFFGAFIIPLATAFYVCEAFGWESGVDKRFKDAKQFYWIILFMIVMAALIVLLPQIPLIKMMLMSQVINGIILPFILISMLILINNKKIMGEFVNSKFQNIITWGTSVVLIALTIAMVVTTFI